MNTFRATAPIALYSGKVKITAEQAKRRGHNLIPTMELKEGDNGNPVYVDGVYVIEPGPIQFKAGEEFGYDGEIPKVYWEAVEDPQPAKKSAKK